jgi:hypothetical protein
VGRAAGKDDPAEHLQPRSPEGARALDELLAYRLGVVHEEGHEEPDDAENEEGDLLSLSRAEPHEQERHERRRGQVAEGRDERIEETLDHGKSAHQHPERQGDDDGEGEADENALHALEDVGAESTLDEEPPKRLEHRDGTGEELVGRELSGREEMPATDEKNPREETEAHGEGTLNGTFELEEGFHGIPSLRAPAGLRRLGRNLGIACRDAVHQWNRLNPFGGSQVSCQ